VQKGVIYAQRQKSQTRGNYHQASTSRDRSFKGIIHRGSPWENGYNESFNGRLRDELLNREIFYTLNEAQILIEHLATITTSAVKYLGRKDDRSPAELAAIDRFRDATSFLSIDPDFYREMDEFNKEMISLMNPDFTPKMAYDIRNDWQEVIWYGVGNVEWEMKKTTPRPSYLLKQKREILAAIASYYNEKPYILTKSEKFKKRLNRAFDNIRKYVCSKTLPTITDSKLEIQGFCLNSIEDFYKQLLVGCPSKIESTKNNVWQCYTKLYTDPITIIIYDFNYAYDNLDLGKGKTNKSAWDMLREIKTITNFSFDFDFPISSR